MYDFTSQNMHYGLNRLKKSKMDKIGLKSGKIAKIGWNRAKSRFQDRFCDFKRKKGHPWSGLGMGTFSLQKRGALCPLCCLLPAMDILQVFLLLFLFLKLSFHLGRGKTLLDKWQKCYQLVLFVITWLQSDHRVREELWKLQNTQAHLSFLNTYRP